MGAARGSGCGTHCKMKKSTFGEYFHVDIGKWKGKAFFFSFFFILPIGFYFSVRTTDIVSSGIDQNFERYDSGVFPYQLNDW